MAGNAVNYVYVFYTYVKHRAAGSFQAVAAVGSDWHRRGVSNSHPNLNIHRVNYLPGLHVIRSAPQSWLLPIL